MTKAEVEAASGESVKTVEKSDGQSIPFTGMKFCSFMSTPPDVPETFLPFPTVQVGLAKTFAKEAFDEFKAIRNYQPQEAIPGLGDEAVWWAHKGEGLVQSVFAILVVLKGDKVVGISMQLASTDLDDPKDKLIKLAGRAVERL